MSCEHRQWLRSPALPKDYEQCMSCGTYRSLKADPSIYADDYWSEKHGHDSLYEQAYNVDLHTENGVSKSRFILDRIASDRGAALEIGCAPGRMLYWLKWAARFEHIIGVDPADKMVIDRISSNAADEIMTRMFPFVPLWPEFADYILAADVFEHVAQPEVFITACARLLKPGGQIFLMLPFADDLPPDSRMFNAVEHAMIHSKRNMTAMMEDAGFERLQVDQWAIGHDAITGFKS